KNIFKNVVEVGSIRSREVWPNVAADSVESVALHASPAENESPVGYVGCLQVLEREQPPVSCHQCRLLAGRRAHRSPDSLELIVNLLISECLQLPRGECGQIAAGNRSLFHGV